MNRLAATIAEALEPALIKEMVTSPGKQLTAQEAAAIEAEHSIVPRRIAEQIVMTVRDALRANPRLIEQMCQAHDKEDAAQRGEPSPWREDLGADQDPEWRAERRAAMLCALEAVGLA